MTRPDYSNALCVSDVVNPAWWDVDASPDYHELAATLCAACPVRDECLVEAIADREQYPCTGVRAGVIVGTIPPHPAAECCVCRDRRKTPTMLRDIAERRGIGFLGMPEVRARR